MFRSDSRGEYISHKFREFLTDQGTIPQLSCLVTPQQNGVAERKHRHVIETARFLIYSSHVPLCFWGESVLRTIYLINRTPSSVLSGCPLMRNYFTSKPVFFSVAAVRK